MISWILSIGAKHFKQILVKPPFSVLNFHPHLSTTSIYPYCNIVPYEWGDLRGKESSDGQSHYAVHLPRPCSMFVYSLVCPSSLRKSLFSWHTNPWWCHSQHCPCCAASHPSGTNPKKVSPWICSWLLSGTTDIMVTYESRKKLILQSTSANSSILSKTSLREWTKQEGEIIAWFPTYLPFLTDGRMVVAIPKVGKIGNWTKINWSEDFLCNGTTNPSMKSYRWHNRSLQRIILKSFVAWSIDHLHPEDCPKLPIGRALWPAGTTSSGTSLQVGIHFT